MLSLPVLKSAIQHGRITHSREGTRSPRPASPISNRHWMQFEFAVTRSKHSPAFISNRHKFAFLRSASVPSLRRSSAPSVFQSLDLALLHPPANRHPYSPQLDVRISHRNSTLRIRIERKPFKTNANSISNRNTFLRLELHENFRPALAPNCLGPTTLLE